MDIFSQVRQGIDDFGMCWNAFDAADEEARKVVAAVGERIERDKAAHVEQVETLTAQSMDQTRPEVLRKLAVRELEQMKGRTFGPSEDETAAFYSTLSDAQAALHEAAKAKAKLEELFEAAKVELRRMKAKAYEENARDTNLAKRWIESRREDFDRLSEKSDASSGADIAKTFFESKQKGFGQLPGDVYGYVRE